MREGPSNEGMPAQAVRVPMMVARHDTRRTGTYAHLRDTETIKMQNRSKCPRGDRADLERSRLLAK